MDSPPDSVLTHSHTPNKLVKMERSVDYKMCFICQTSNKKSHVVQNSSLSSIQKLIDSINTQALYKNHSYIHIQDRLANISAQELKQNNIVWHVKCYSNATNCTEINRSKNRFTSAINNNTPIGTKKGRPIVGNITKPEMQPSHSFTRSHLNVYDRSKCLFCQQVTTDKLSQTRKNKCIVQIIENCDKDEWKFHFNQVTSCDHIMYHKLCLTRQWKKYCNHQPSADGDGNHPDECIHCTDKSDQEQESQGVSSSTKIGQQIADIDILNAVTCSLISGAVITMNDINEEYVSLLAENNVEPGNSHHKKYLKTIISENIEDASFIKSHRKYESEQVISLKLLGKCVSDVREQQNDEDGVKCIAKAAAILREQVAAGKPWKFTGSKSLTEFTAPPILTSFLTWLLLGSKSRDLKEKRDDASKKSVNLISQHICHNIKTTRQLSYQPISNTGFRNRMETPLSIGLALAIHKKTRSEGLVNVLSNLQIASSYHKVVNIEKRIACGVAERMKTTGGFCLPSFVTKGKSIYFAADNIDFLENTADGQNTLHGTILVINQNNDNTQCIPVNEPLFIPDESFPVDVNVNFINPPSIEPKPITVNKFEFRSHDKFIRNCELSDRTWLMATFAHRNTNPISVNCEEPSTGEYEHNQTESPNKCTKTDVMPTWAATNSLLIQSKQKVDQLKTQSAVVAPLLRKSPTDFSVLYTVLCLSQGISAFVVGPNHKTLITLDLDLYERAMKLQSSTSNSNWILRVGELHACFASLHGIAKYLEGSGLDSISIENGLYSPSTIRQIFTGKWFRRGIEYHMTNVMACYDLLFEASTKEESLDTLVTKCHELRHKLHSRNADVTDIFEEACVIFSDRFHTILDKDVGELGVFLKNYMKQVESLLHLIRGSREGSWELHLGALEEQVKYYFAHDLYKYARLVPLYLAQMQTLRETDPETWNDLNCGDFMVVKSGIPFTNLFVDQTLEQLIKELKVAGGITGITQNENALDRFFLIAPELISIVHKFQEEHCTTNNNTTKDKEHYQLTGEIAIRMFHNSSKIKEGIVKHCNGNPFTCKSTLVNISSNMEVPACAKDDILRRDEIGTNKYEEFVSDRLIESTARTSIWDPMRKLKLKTFNTCHKKTKCKIDNKLVKLREDRQLLARFLVVQQSRPTMIESLCHTIGKFEFSVIPRSLFSADGLLLIPTDKSSFIHAIEAYDIKAPTESVEDPCTSKTTDTNEDRYKVCVIDAMAIVQSIKKGPLMQNCYDFSQAFVRTISKLTSTYDEARVIFDRYIENSLKSQTRGKRAAGVVPVKFDIRDSTNIKLVPLPTLLSHTATKSQLTEYLGRALLREYEHSNLTLIVVFGTSTYSNKQNVFDTNISEHSHEEADTLIPMHVLDASTIGGNIRDVHVHSPDTDVFILLMDLYSSKRIPGELLFITGKGKSKRTINIETKCLKIGIDKCKGLLGLHNFTGADWGGKFASISKSRWMKEYLQSNLDVVDAFQKLGEETTDIDSLLVAIEAFVCSVYAKNTKCKTVKELRWHLFKTKNLEAEKLPPSLGALKPHIQRANFVSRIGKGYKHPRPYIPPLTDNGWEKIPDGTIWPTKCLELPAPQAIIELVKCGCRGDCSKTSNCSCQKNNLPCTPICKCHDCGNTNDYNVASAEEDTDYDA